MTTVALAAAAPVMLAGGMAWACSGHANVVGVTPPAGTAGSQVRVVGEGAPTSALQLTVNAAGQRALAPVEIRWNALDGPVVGTATPDAKGGFVAMVTAPAAPPGVYSLVAVASGVGWGRAAFEVTPSAGSQAAGAPSTPWAAPASAASAPPSPAGTPLGLAVGAGLLGGGLVALTGGFVVAAARRPRATVRGY